MRPIGGGSSSTGTPDWTRVGTANFSATAASTSTITMNTDMTQTIKTGMGVRTVSSAYAAIFNDGGGQITASALTGLSSASHLDYRGRIHFSVVDEGAGNYHTNLYKSSARGAGDLIAHTASYAAGGAKAITADNGSGLGGTITVGGVFGADTDIYAEYFRWGIVETMASNLLTLRGAALSTTASDLLELWYAAPKLTEQIDFFIGGAYALSTTSTKLADKANSYFLWRGSPARLVQFYALSKTTSATKPYINVLVAAAKVCSANGDDGLQMAADATWYNTVVDIYASRYGIERGNAIEISAKLGATTNTLDENLSVSCVFIRE